MVAPVSDENKLSLRQRSDSPLFTRAIKPLSQKAAETDKLDEILREFGRIREHQVKEAEKMGKAVARVEGSIAELTSRFKVVEENVQLLLQKNP